MSTYTERYAAMMPPPPPPPKRTSLVPLYVIGLVLVVLVGGGGFLAYHIVKHRHDDFPEAWDPTVLPFVQIVEAKRGLAFLHPVYVDFLDDASFNQALDAGGGDEGSSADDTQEVDAATATFRALGLIGPDVDLTSAGQTIGDTQVIGFYSFADQRIRVRGSLLGLDAQATLVHELTHALQDQQLHVGERADELAKSGDTTLASTFQAVVEGDADQVETAWQDTLPAHEKALLMRARKKSAKQALTSAVGVPPVLLTFLSAPYALGEGLTTLATELGGHEAVNALEKDPPTSDEQVLDPWTLIHDHDQPIAVPVPALAPGETELDHGTFGAIEWNVLLGQRVPAREVFAAVDGWGGDAYSVFSKGDRSCIRIAYVGDTPRDLAQMRTAIQDWIDAGPPRSAIVTTSRGRLTLSSCSTDGKVRGHSVVLPFAFSLERTVITYSVLDAQPRSRVSPTQARCFAQRATDRYTAPQFAAAGPDALGSLFRSCA